MRGSSSSRRCRKWGSLRREETSLASAFCIVPTNSANLISTTASGLLLLRKMRECSDVYSHHTTVLQGASRNNGDVILWVALMAILPQENQLGRQKSPSFCWCFCYYHVGSSVPPPAPRNIWQLCRKIDVTLNPPPVPGPSCPCAAMSWEPLWIFASPQDSRYKVKDRFLLLKFPSLHVMWLGIGERAGSLLRDPHQPPASTVSN